MSKKYWFYNDKNIEFLKNGLWRISTKIVKFLRISTNRAFFSRTPGKNDVLHYIPDKKSSFLTFLSRFS